MQQLTLSVLNFHFLSFCCYKFNKKYEFPETQCEGQCMSFCCNYDNFIMLSLKMREISIEIKGQFMKQNFFKEVVLHIVELD